MPRPPRRASGGFTDITYHHSTDGRIARIAFNRPEVRNAFRPHTVDELYRALEDARTNPRIGVVLLTGNGPSPKDGGWAFCSGGDQRIRGRDGYKYSDAEADGGARPAAAAATGRLHILEVQRLIRFMPKVVIAVVPGLGGRRRALAARRLRPHDREPRARPVQADGCRRRQLRRRLRQRVLRPPDRAEVRPRGVLPRRGVLGRARLRDGRGERASCRTPSSSATAIAMARTILTKSPTAIRMLKFAFNAVDDGMVGQQVFAGEATRLAYGTDEAVEGRDAFLEKRDPDWGPYPWHY